MIDMVKRRRYNLEYQNENYDRVAIRVKKGKRREYQQAAREFGMSFRELIQRGVEEFIARHKAEEVEDAKS